MAIVESAGILEHQLFKQGDARDPLGIWTIRHPLVGDASGGTIKVSFTSPNQSRIYTCYGLNIAGVNLNTSGGSAKVRLLTNFPPGTPTGGVAAFSTLRIVNDGWDFQTNMTDPKVGLNFAPINAVDRFILLFGPVPQGESPIAIVETEIINNVDGAGYVFEGYGYFWDRAILQVAGGPRHPGSG